MKYSLLELGKDFIELKDKELKGREVKIKREMEELFLKPINMLTDGVDKFEQEEMKKKRSFKNTWYDWLINYVPNQIRKTVGVLKTKVVSVFKTNTLEEFGKQNVYGSGNSPSKLKIQRKSEHNRVSITNLFKLKKK